MPRPAAVDRRARPSSPGARSAARAWAAAALLCASGLAGAPARAADALAAPPSAAHRHEDFGPALAPYGQWLTLADLGVVWQPQKVDAGWAPYRQGRWAWTRLGWFWVSDEPWGWATYHYGRWAFHATHGWVWTPGAAWAPAWVAWRTGASVVGWSPLPPHGARLLAGWTFVPVARFAGEPVSAVAFAQPRVPALLVATAGHAAPPPLWSADGMRSEGTGSLAAALPAPEPEPERAAPPARLGASPGVRSRH